MTDARNSRPNPRNAGIGKVEGWLARHVVFPVFCRTTTFEDATALFEREGRRIEELCGQFTPDEFTRRVLVAPLPGIEDTSRDWSAAMLVEHVVTVGDAISRILVFLSRSQVPPYPPEIAGLRPKGDGGITIMAEFRRLLREYPELVGSDLPRPANAPRYPHPVYGDLDMHHWHCLSAMHLRLHRRHLFLIRKNLRAGPPAAKTPSVFADAAIGTPPATTG